MAAIVWLIIGIVLVVAEVLSGTFVLVMLGAAALAAAVASALGVPLVFSAVVFAVLATGGLVLVRPAVVRRMHQTPQIKTNTDALVGRKATVVTEVTADSGQVKIDGQLWSARAYDETEVLETGRSVTIMSISGACAVVWGGP